MLKALRRRVKEQVAVAAAQSEGQAVNAAEAMAVHHSSGNSAALYDMVLSTWL